MTNVPFFDSDETIAQSASVPLIERLSAMPVDKTIDAQPLDPASELLRQRLIERVRAITSAGTPVEKLLPGLHLSYLEKDSVEPNCFYTLSIGLILQGTKRLLIGGKTYQYGAGSMIVTSVDVPTSYELIGVKPSEPFISLSFRLDPGILAEYLAQELPAEADAREVFNVERPAIELLEDFERLLRLVDRPEQIKSRAPMLIRDLHYLALAGASGQCLRALYVPGAVGQRIRKAIRWLRENFREPVAVESLAELAGMAPTTFHRHFKALTSFSPLQYQKRLRLYEAQQFLLRGEGDVNSAAYAVGYQSPQQFNRDYKSLFGTTPGRSARARRTEMLEAAR